MDVEIKKKDGSTYRLSDYGVVYDFVVHSITIDNYTERIEGRSGFVDYGADYGSRRITVPMKFKHYDMHDYAHLRDEVYGILSDIDSYYIREMRRPKRLEYEFVDFGQTPKFKDQTDNQYVGGKQFLVRMVSEITPEQMYNGGEIEIEFETTELPFSETIYTTMDLNNRSYSADESVFGTADGIHSDHLKYVFSNNTFEVWNGGNVTVEPESMYINIRLRSLVTSGGFTLKNLTTGDSFVYNSERTGNTIDLSGTQVIMGNVQNRLRDTNRQFISIAPGVNRFEYSGGSVSQIEFDFKFYSK